MNEAQAGRTAFVFPGQGAQQVGMFSTLLGDRPLARQRLAEAEAVLGRALGQVIEHGPEDALRATATAQPALLVVSVACAEVLASEADLRPDIVLGHSVGEYAALVVSGALAFADGVRLVAERGRLMEAAARTRPGGMVAVIGAPHDALAEVVADCQGHGILEITNDNAPGQVVLSGERAALDEAQRLLRERRCGRAVPLRVSAPFHSVLMRPMAEEFAAFLAGVALRPPGPEFIDNVSAEPERDPERIRAKLVAQLHQPVRWRQSVETALERGATRFVECGPGRTLLGLIKRIRRGTTLQTARALLQDSR